jgi:RimJ/RimL family protein N-acetyltransferase
MELPRPRPARVTLEGRYCRLEPLTTAHAAGLYESCRAPELYRWLSEFPPGDEADMRAWVETARTGDERLFFAVIDRVSGKVAGRQALLNIVPAHGVVEIGSICWGEGARRTRIATEALYLFARYAFEDLGYRRFEWKCNDGNAPSRNAALRFGFTFEGIFRQHMWIKGANRDSAWFSMLDGEWPRLQSEYGRWLAPGNFDSDGGQRSRLETGAQ